MPSRQGLGSALTCTPESLSRSPQDSHEGCIWLREINVVDYDCRIGQSARALADLERAQMIEPDDVTLWRASAAIKVGKQDFASAASDLYHADRMQPHTLSVVSERSIVYLHRGCFQVQPFLCLINILLLHEKAAQILRRWHPVHELYVLVGCII